MSERNRQVRIIEYDENESGGFYKAELVEPWNEYGFGGRIFPCLVEFPGWLWKGKDLILHNLKPGDYAQIVAGDTKVRRSDVTTCRTASRPNAEIVSTQIGAGGMRYVTAIAYGGGKLLLPEPLIPETLLGGVRLGKCLRVAVLPLADDARRDDESPVNFEIRQEKERNLKRLNEIRALVTGPVDSVKTAKAVRDLLTMFIETMK